MTCVPFYAGRYRPDNATLLVVGDVTPERVLPLLESSFGGWKAPGGTAAKSTLADVAQPAARTVYLVDKPGAPQSQIRIGWLGVPRSTPDYFPIQVMNTILGGAFSSRLNLNLREKHGYTYGAASSFDMRMTAGPFAAMAGVQTDKTKRVAAGVLQRAERHPAAGSGRRARAREELRRAADFLAGSRRPATSRAGSKRC